MSFGKRQPGAAAAAYAIPSSSAGVRSQAVADLATTRSPIRWFLACLAFTAALCFHVVTYAPDIIRDHRLASSWQPAYDLKAMEGKCRRTNFVLTSCTVKIKSVARPDQAPIETGFFMLFSGGGGEALVPVRSTTDRAAVSIAYSAETKLLNRTLSFVIVAVLLILMDLASLLVFWKSIN